MPTNNSNFNALFKKLASVEIHENIKRFISGLYDQLGSLQATSFKPEHRDEFINLRSQCRDLINQTRGFCDKAIPSLEYALEQFQSPNPVNVKTLAEKLLSRIDPTQVLTKCEQLENQILTLNDRIANDEYYKTSKIIPFLCSGAGGVVAIASLIGLVFAPVVLEIEIALTTVGSLMAKNVIPSIILMSQGLSKIEAEKDLKKCKTQLIEANELINQMKMKLSDVTQNHGRLEIRLDDEDIRDLQPIYQNLLNDMQEIRTLCSKPFPT